MQQWEKVVEQVKAVSGVEGKKKASTAVQKLLSVLEPQERACFLVVACGHGGKRALVGDDRAVGKSGEPLSATQVGKLVASAKKKLDDAG